MRWAEHVACVCERSGACAVKVGETLGKRQLERFICRLWTILKWILMKSSGKPWSLSLWLMGGISFEIL
jgi:hypothetical protein